MLYLNFEDERLLGFDASDFERMLAVQAELSENSTIPSLFLDEVRAVDGWETFARRMADAGADIIVAVSGSIADAVPDERFARTRIFPLSFREILRTSCVASDEDALSSTVGRAAIFRAFARYLKTGGFPECVPLENPRDTLHELYRTVWVNNPRLKSKALQLLPRQRRIRPVYVRPLSHQPVTQTLQISTCIEVAVRTVTTVAFEPVLFTLSNGTACRTGLACVFGVNKHHADADTTGFVDDHLLKLAERPTVQPGTNSESRPDPFPDMGKIFQDDQSFSLRLSFFYDLFADHVIHLFHMSSFSARDSFQRAFGVSRTIALKTSSVTQELVAVIL